METIAMIFLTAFGLFYCYWMVREGENVKLAYERNYTTDADMRFHPLYPCTFTKAEEEAFEALSQANSETLWGTAIHAALENGKDFRQLIDSLYSQGIDNEQLMISMIGEHGWMAVMNCRRGKPEGEGEEFKRQWVSAPDFRTRKM